MRGQRDSDWLIGRLASRQHGVVTRRQLLGLGLGSRAIENRIASGRLVPLHRGVYAVGHRALRVEGRLLAAVVACGTDAVLSHAAAAALWELRPTMPQRIDVTVPTAAGRRARHPIRLHRHAGLGAEERTRHRGIPITTPARTLLDLAAAAPRRALERALDQAEVLRLIDARRLRTLLDAHPRRPGTPVLAALLAEHDLGSTLTKSELEERFLALCDAHDLPRPKVNVRLWGLEVDFHWPDRTRTAFERDRARDARLATAGLRVHRFTDRQIARAPDAVVAALRRSLSTLPP
jgi:hypothetical protein